MALGTLFLSGCSSTGLYLLNSSLKLGADHSVEKNIQYGERDWQRLDVHVPTANTETPRPVLVFFYGGSWDSGRKEMYYFVANSFAKRGYIVVIPDYIKYPDARFPAFMHDGAAALDWVLSNIKDHGGDPNNIVVAGHSAGAHLGALLLSDAQYLAQHERKPQDVKAFVGLAGPYNFTPTSATLVEIFGPPEKFPNMQLNNFVDGDEPPMLLLHGRADETVGLQNQTSFLTKLREHNIDADGKVYDDVGHIKILMSLTPPLKGDVPTLDDMDQFFRRVINGEQVANQSYDKAVALPANTR